MKLINGNIEICRTSAYLHITVHTEENWNDELNHPFNSNVILMTPQEAREVAVELEKYALELEE